MANEKPQRFDPCEKCGHNRWSTVRKLREWMCRNCGNVRQTVYQKRVGDDKKRKII